MVFDGESVAVIGKGCKQDKEEREMIVSKLILSIFIVIASFGWCLFLDLFFETKKTEQAILIRFIAILLCVDIGFVYYETKFPLILEMFISLGLVYPLDWICRNSIGWIEKIFNKMRRKKWIRHI